MVVYENDFFKIEANQDNSLFICVSSPGYVFTNFNNIVIDLPVIQLTNFISLKKALEDASGEPVQIGILRPRVELILSSDELQASIKLNISAKEIAENAIGISSEIVEVLKSNDITEGIESDLFSKTMTAQKEFPVAKGIPPKDGDDAKVTYYNISEKKPIIRDDGSINFYELNLIDNVSKGDWLGEKIPAKEGTPGKTVTGKVIPARKGRDIQLKYDRKTIGEFEEDDKIVLRALNDGAIKFEDGRIKVDDHFIIKGDVDYNTGNIDFEGNVTICGTVIDNFSVIAKGDISINGDIGIGAVDRIYSKEGSIYIKGGIYGRGLAKIEAAKNVYIRYCNECTIIAGDEINVGFYSLDSCLTAKNIFLDPVNGKIIGGCINAEIQVTAGIIGNRAEKKTKISVKGFDRLAIKAEFEKILISYKNLLTDASKVKRQIEVYENSMAGAEYANVKEYKDYYKKYETIIDELKELDEYRNKLQKILSTKGEGAVDVMKAAYPETYLEIKNLSKKINSVVNGTFYFDDRALHHK